MSTPYYLHNNNTKNSRNNNKDGGFSVIAAAKNEQNNNSQELLIGRDELTIQQQRTQKKFWRWRDPIWAILYYLHLICILLITIKYVPIALSQTVNNNNNNRRLHHFSIIRSLNEGEDSNDENENIIITATNILLLLLIIGLGGLLLSTVIVILMMKYTQTVIKIALLFNIGCLMFITIISFASLVIEIGFLALFVLLISCYYTYIVWNDGRIEFASSNLRTAIFCLSLENNNNNNNMMGGGGGLLLLCIAYVNLILGFVYTIVWIIGFGSTFFVLGGCDLQGNCQNNINGFFVFCFFVSYYWTIQIIKNIIKVTVAGTVGIWWYTNSNEGGGNNNNGDDTRNGCCSSSSSNMTTIIQQSYCRSITTSFGSICFGSLFVSFISIVREIFETIKEIATDSKCSSAVLGCSSIADYCCFHGQILLETFNQWAFVYVAIKQYPFLEAGQKVMYLFQSRGGWTAIITDILVDTVLLMVSVGVSLLNGIVGLIVTAAIMKNVDINDNDDSNTTYLCGSFLIGILIGFIMCNTLFSLISSAVDAIIVCYAEAPNELDVNHPQVSIEMRTAWQKAYPSEFDSSITSSLPPPSIIT